MGLVYQKVTLHLKKKVAVRMLVDTGASYSVISKELARKVGITPAGKRYRVRLANGRAISMDIGVALFRVDGREAPATVLIGPVDEPLLGAETLEALGLAVDPSTGCLRRTRSYSVRLGGYR